MLKAKYKKAAPPPPSFFNISFLNLIGLNLLEKFDVYPWKSLMSVHGKV